MKKFELKADAFEIAQNMIFVEGGTFEMGGEEEFFDDVKPVKQTLHGHFGAQQACERFLINTDIVNRCKQ